MLDTTNLTAVISVNPHATMESSFSLRALGSSDLQVDMQPRIFNNIPCSIGVPASSNTTLQASINPKYQSTIEASINLRLVGSLPASISVNPKATMEAIFEVVKPVPKILALTPNKDTFVRNGIPRINYGYEEEALVGIVNEEEFKAMYSFDLSDLPKDIVINKADLKLFNLDNSSPVNVDIYQTGYSWPEYSTTWANKPEATTKLTSTVLGETYGYKDIDVSSSIFGWADSADKGVSLVLQSTDTTGITRVSTKENRSVGKPMLYIEYIDKYPKSSGNAKLPCNISIKRNNSDTLDSSITINSYNIVENFPCSITVPKYSGVPQDLVASISVSLGRLTEVPASITVPIYDGFDSLASSISSRVFAKDNLQASIRIPIYDMSENLDASISARVFAKEDLQASIKVPVYDMSENLDASISARVVAKENLQASIKVPIYDDNSALQATIDIRAVGISDLQASIKVPIYDDSSTIQASIETRVLVKAYLQSSINVPSYDGTGELPASIDPRVNKDMLCSIQVRCSDSGDLPATVKIRPVVDLEAEIFVISGYLAASITVPTKDRTDIPCAIRVSIRYISDIPCYIRVGCPGSYVYIM